MFIDFHTASHDGSERKPQQMRLVVYANRLDHAKCHSRGPRAGEHDNEGQET